LKAKVAHLFKKLEEIERDTVELKKLADRIAEDREYSPMLRESFLSEMTKLDEQKSDILRVSVSHATPIKSESRETVPAEIPSPTFAEGAVASEKKKTDKQIRKY
jgi:hypothetical protein